MRQANPRTIANKDIRKNPKCTVHDGDNNGNSNNAPATLKKQ